MEPLVLSDKSEYPTEEIIFSFIGENSEHWKSLMEKVHVKFPAADGQWNYYNDGKNWLLKMVYKKKTLFWIGILHDTFRVTFYFGDKAQASVIESEIPDELKQQYLTGPRYGKIRAVSFKITCNANVDDVIKLSEIKSKF